MTQQGITALLSQVFDGVRSEPGDALDAQRLPSDPDTLFCMGCQTDRDAAR